MSLIWMPERPGISLLERDVCCVRRVDGVLAPWGGGGQPEVPLRYPGLVQWLDGANPDTIVESGGNVATWLDSSGEGNDATAVSVSQNIVYDENGGYIDNNYGAYLSSNGAGYAFGESAYTVIWVARPIYFGAYDRVYRAWHSTGSAASIVSHYSGTGLWVGRNNGLGSTQSWNMSTSSYTADLHIFSWVVDGETLNYWFDGEQRITNATTYYGTGGTYDRMNWLAWDGASGQIPEAYMAAGLIYTRAFSSTELLALEAYLRSRHNAAAAL